MKTATIGTTNVNLEHPDHNFKNLKDLRKNEVVFAHLEGDERAEAQSQLWEALGSKDVEEVVDSDLKEAYFPQIKDIEYPFDKIDLSEEIKEG